MSDFFGVISRKQAPVKEAWLQHMQKTMALWEPDYSKILSLAYVGLGQNSLRITPESLHESLPETRHNLSLVANARIDNREELLKLLDVPKAEVITDASIILTAYEKWGTRCAEKLIGEFAFAIWDESEQSLFCAKDALGTRPLYYHVGPEFVVISTEVRGLFASGLVPKRLNELMLAVHLSAFKAEQAQTTFEGVFSLRAAHWLLSKGDTIRIECYWSPSIKPELKLKDNREYEEAFSEKLQTAVKRRLRSAFPVGSLMSGGLDSTAITGIALKQNSEANPLHIQSWVYAQGAQQGAPDDREYVEEFLKFHSGGNYQHTFVHGLDGYFSLLPKLQQFCDQPFLDMELPVRFDSYQQFQQKNVRVLMTGIGGDQFATYKASEYPFHLLTQLRFLKAYQTLQNIKQVDNLIWRQAIGAYIARPFRDVCTGVEPWGRGHPHAGRNFLSKRAGKLFINADLISRTQFKDFIVDHAATQNLTSPWDNPLKKGLLMTLRNGGLDISFNQRYHVTQAYKMQYTYPMLDRDLVSLLLSLPPDQFHQNGLGRSIVRRSLGQFVPAKVLNKVAKIGSAPFLGQTIHGDLPWVFCALERWKNNPTIERSVNLQAFESHLNDLKSGKAQTDRFYVRTVFLCSFLQNAFN